MERFFLLVNRLNSLLLLLVLLGAAVAIAWMSAENSHWRRRGAIEVAATEPATGNSVLMAFERAEVITGSQTLMLRLTSSHKSAGFSSGGGGSETRNVLFLAGADKAPHWLFADQRHLVLTLAQLREDAAPEDRARAGCTSSMSARTATRTAGCRMTICPALPWSEPMAPA